jgi:hypothetical protein
MKNFGLGTLILTLSVRIRHQRPPAHFVGPSIYSVPRLSRLRTVLVRCQYFAFGSPTTPPKDANGI